MLHLWLVIYGVDDIGRGIVGALAHNDSAGHCRLLLGIVEKIEELPPSAVAGFWIVAKNEENLQLSSEAGTHILFAAFAMREQRLIAFGALLGAAIQRGKVRTELLLQDEHPRNNPRPPHIEAGNSLVFCQEFWLRPGENGGKPTIEPPLPPGPSN